MILLRFHPLVRLYSCSKKSTDVLILMSESAINKYTQFRASLGTLLGAPIARCRLLDPRQGKLHPTSLRLASVASPALHSYVDLMGPWRGPY